MKSFNIATKLKSRRFRYQISHFNYAVSIIATTQNLLHLFDIIFFHFYSIQFENLTPNFCVSKNRYFFPDFTSIIGRDVKLESQRLPREITRVQFFPGKDQRIQYVCQFDGRSTINLSQSIRRCRGTFFFFFGDFIFRRKEYRGEKKRIPEIIMANKRRTIPDARSRPLVQFFFGMVRAYSTSLLLLSFFFYIPFFLLSILFFFPF